MGQSIPDAVSAGDDWLTFVDDEASPGPTHRAPPWRVLVVDDDPDVHATTTFALQGTVILGRPVELLHAYSAAQAREVLAGVDDLAVILLDVVMETPEAGLALVAHVRHERGLTATRIVLRTGQPGYAPEHETLARYDINDYKSKAEFTQHKLVTTIMGAVRSYEQIRTIEASRAGLQQIVEGAAGLLERSGLHPFAEGVLDQLARLLQTTPEGLVAGRRPGDEGSYTVLAATGPYAVLLGQPLDCLSHHPAVRCMEQALQRRDHHWGADGKAFYVGGVDGLDLVAYLPDAQPFDALTRQLLEVLCVNLVACLRNLGLIQRLRRVAYEDPLLGIPNRAYLIELIDSTQGLGESRTLALFDIDDFGGINELMGHAFGDRVLRALADRLRALVPPEVTVARVSSNAFGLLGPRSLLRPESAHAALGDALQVDRQPFRVHTSVGVCDEADFTGRGVGALQNASIALKHAKQQHRGSLVRFDRDMAQRSRHHAELLTRLNAAFNENQLFLAYQPQIDLGSGRVIGLEALVRWRREDGELVPPDTFIPVAERSGLIDALGTWVFKTACHDMRRLMETGLAPDRMAINVSVMQFGNPRFIEHLEQALTQLALPPERLELEITESVAMLGAGVVEPMLAQLRARGVSIAIDDFGTGYSSLAYLERLPLDRIKIDRSFVRQLQTGQGPRIAEMITQLGVKLGLRVLAEGIEDAEVWHHLASIGCHEGQGFHIARPMPFDELAAWLENWHAAHPG